MTSLSPKLGLTLATTADRFSTADLKANWEKVDAAPGVHVCTSSTRPLTWGVSQAGRTILETNTSLEWLWTGTAWVRTTGGLGILSLTGGTKAVGERTTNFSTSSTTFVKAISLPGVVIPAGNRPLMLVATWTQADNNAGPFAVAIFRSNVNNSGPQMSRIIVQGSASNTGSGMSHVSFERGGLAAGTYDFSLQVRSSTGAGGTSWLYADPDQPIQLTVCEL